MLKEYDIDILSMQETEITNCLNEWMNESLIFLLSKNTFVIYNLELEKNSLKSRVGFYIGTKHQCSWKTLILFTVLNDRSVTMWKPYQFN